MLDMPDRVRLDVGLDGQRTELRGRWRGSQEGGELSLLVGHAGSSVWPAVCKPPGSHALLGGGQ